VVAMRRLAILAVLALLGCAPMLDGAAPASSRPVSHFVVVVHNLDVGADDTATVTWWKDSTIRGTRAQLVPAGGEVRFDLETFPPDGFQVITTPWNGLPGGPGGAIWQTPDYDGAWIFNVCSPNRFTWKGP
jgi:hypothetical protein